MLPLLKRHEIQVLLAAGFTPTQVAERADVSVDTVRRVKCEPAVSHVDDVRERRTRGIGRPSKAAPFADRVREWLAEEPDLPTQELLRRAKEAGFAGRKSAFYSLVAGVRERRPAPPMVRFERLPGEFSQHDFGQVDVRFVDEVGYLAVGNDAANVLFHVVNERHIKRRSMIFTANKPPGGWGDVLHDDDLAEVIVDRVLERGRLLKLDGPSVRTKHLADDVGPGDDSNESGDRRFSGIGAADFPETTSGRRPPVLLASWHTPFCAWPRSTGPRSPRISALFERTARREVQI